MFSISALGAAETREQVLERLRKQSVYQDVIVNNEVVLRGWGPCCSSRYQAIKKVLNLYERPITVLDIGANLGYFSLRIAHDYDSTCVMVDFQKQLFDICRLNSDRNNIIFLNKSLTAGDLKQLAECEHFDVVLALHVVHHMPDWEEALEAIFRLGDNIIIETPPADDAVVDAKPNTPIIAKVLEERRDGVVIARTERYTPGTFSNMYWFSGNHEGIQRKHWGAPKNTAEQVISNFQEKKYRGRPWIKGINSRTFKALNGVFPFYMPLEMEMLLQGKARIAF